MADPFGTGAGIIGVIGLAIQITQAVVQFGTDWKDVPDNVKLFMAELGTLKTVLSETNTNLLLNPDFAKVFEGQRSLLLSQLGPDAISTTDTKIMLQRCHKDLEDVLSQLKKREQGHSLGWERLKGAFWAKYTQNSVVALCRQCQALNNMLSIDAAVIGARTYNEVRDARFEQRGWNHEIKSGIEQSNKWEENQERRAILDWLTTIDHASQQSDCIGRRQQGTGQWLLDSTPFQAWSSTRGQTMFCPGIPGAGKTILTSVVIEELSTKFREDKSVGIAYLYCNFRRQHEQKIEDLFASLLKQLAQSLPSLPEAIKLLHESHHQSRMRPSLKELSTALQSVAIICSRTFIVIDAIDECQVSDGCRQRLLSEVFELQAIGEVSFFATSRFIPEITRSFQNCHSLEIRATESDVTQYVESHMSRLPSFVQRKAGLQDEIKQSIVKAVDGMFLLAQLHIDSIAGKTSPKAIRNALQCLPTGSDAYDRAYKDAMIRIEGHVADQVQLAKQVMCWITCARRPVTTIELQHALAVEFEERCLDEENLPDTDDMVSVCAGLVTIDEESSIIRLIHYTTQEYFDRTKTRWFPNAERKLTAICMTYLSFDVFSSGFCKSEELFQDRLRTNPFYEYAAENWGHHAHRTIESFTFDDKLKQDMLDVLRDDAKMDSSSQMLVATLHERRDATQSYSQRVPSKVVGLHVAAFFGLETIVKALVEIKPDNVDSRDSDGQTPLSWAAENGHPAVVRTLLDTGEADPNSRDKQGKTPLAWASLNGHTRTVETLLESGAVHPDLPDKRNRTPLLWSARKGHESVVKLLLATKRVDINLKDTTHGLTPLAWAADHKHTTIVEILFELTCVDAARMQEVREMLKFADELPSPGLLNSRPIPGSNVSWSKHLSFDASSQITRTDNTSSQ